MTFPQNGPYPPINGSGFTASFVRTGGPAAAKNPGEIMASFPAADLPVLNALATEFAVCDRWFSSMPGPTLPNRFFLLAGSSGGLDHSPTNPEMLDELLIDGVKFENGTIFSRPIETRIYCGGVLCMAQTMHGVNFTDVHRYADFTRDVASGNYDAKFTLIEPDYGDITGSFKGGNSQHPMDGVTGGEGLIKHVYETIRNSHLWEKSLLLVLWDEHGGFYDHVLPGKAVPPGDAAITDGINRFGFDFSLYGPRVAAVVISPWVPRNLVDHRLYDHTSVLATVEAMFGMKPFTKRDAAARTVIPLLSLAAPRATPQGLPAPAPCTVEDKAADKFGPANDGNVPAFLLAALRTHLDLAANDLRDGIVARVKQIKTKTEADEYFREIRARVGVARAAGRAQSA